MSIPTLEQKIEAMRDLLSEIVEHPEYNDSPYRVMAVLSENCEDKVESEDEGTHDYELFIGGDLIDAMDMITTFVQNLLEEVETKEDTSLIVSSLLHTLQEHVSQEEE